MKKRMSLISVILIIILAFSGCSSPKPASSGGKTQSGAGAVDKSVKQELNYVSTIDVINLSPILLQDTASSNVVFNIFEPLFQSDPATGKIKPLLAESYSNPNDNKWVIKLKKNIKFQDGTPFTSEAVKYTFDKIRDPKTASPRASLLGPVSSVETPDDYTVVINTKTPYGIMLTALADLNLSIVNPKADKSEDINKSPVGAGTGPFMFKEWVPGDHVTLVKNPNYWNGAPKLDTLNFKVVPEMSTAVSMLEDGEADYLTGVPPEQYDRLKSNPDIKIIKEKGNRLEYLSFNLKKKPFDDIKVREAVEYAIDRDAYIKTLNGLGYKSNGLLSPQSIGYNKDVESHGYNYDPAKAKQLLKEAGYPNGFSTVLTLGNKDALLRLAPFIQDQLGKVGIKVKINSMDFAAAIPYKKAGKHELYLNGWSNDSGDGEEFFYPELHSASIGATNYSNYSDPAADQLILKTRTTVDQKQRTKYLEEANIKFADDPIIIPLHFDVYTLAYRSSVKGIVYGTNGDITLTKAYKTK